MATLALLDHIWLWIGNLRRRVRVTMGAVISNLRSFIQSDEDFDVLSIGGGLDAGGIEIRVRQSLSAEARGLFQRKLMALELDGQTNAIKLKDLSWEKQNLLTCQSFILDWKGLYDDKGEPVPYSPDLLPSFRGEVIDEIAQGIDKLQTARKEQLEKKE